MRVLLFILILTLHWTNSTAQQGKQWITGFGNIIDFRVTPTISFMQCDTFNNALYMHGHSSICDSNGKLLFAHSGILPIKKCENIIENGNVDVGNHFEFDAGGNGQFIQESIIIPKKNNQYYVFRVGVSNDVYDAANNGTGDVYFDKFFYDIIDMKENNGDGRVVERKHILIENERLSINMLNAVKHANGRDWWVVKPGYLKNTFYTFLVTPDTVLGPYFQDLQGPEFHWDYWGQCNFSLDGQFFVMGTYLSDYVQINKFDRCSGQMTKYRSLVPPEDTNWYYDPFLKIDTFEMNPAETGFAFSSDNHFLYLVSPVSVWQYDMETEEMINIKNDSLINYAWNITAYNAPDGRIYTGNWNGANYGLSYIEFPNKKGIDAHFCQICLSTAFTTSVPPNMPNYELGALKGSPCDTIRPKHVYDVIKIYPNPVSDYLTIELPTGSKKVQVNIYNMLGEVVLSKTIEEIQNHKVELSVKHFARALYNVRINANGASFVGNFLKE